MPATKLLRLIRARDRAVADVQNNATIAARRRARHSGREAEASGAARKHA
jgi:hypothetical protein